MLSTIAFFLVGITVMIRCLRHKKCFAISPDLTPLKRDLSFFIPMYSLAVFLPLIIGRSMDMIIALALLLGYVFYVKLTMTGESSEIGHFEGLHLFKAQKRLRLTKKDEPHTSMFFFQIIMALIVMVLGARIFVGGLEVVSLRLGMNPLLFALILAPLATELPEKFNSVTWILKGKDSLAMGNLTGAMMFQSTFPVAIGLLFTKWELTPMAIFSAVLALSSAGIALFSVKRSGRLSPYALLSGGFLYLVYIVTLVFNIKG
jgi:cation:H+ antiporter